MQSANSLYIYRVKSKVEQIWNILICTNSHSLSNRENVKQEVQQKCALMDVDIDVNTISESTTIYDIDFNEIFENDIIEFTYYNKHLVGVVVYSKLPNNDDALTIYCNCNQYEFHLCDNIKVIGNIHENIELLYPSNADMNTNVDVLSKHLPPAILEVYKDCVNT